MNSPVADSPIENSNGCSRQPSKKSHHILIIGAGSTGLLLAQGLSRSGIPFTIFEAKTQDAYASRPRTWSMSLHWGADYIRKVLSPDMLKDFRANVETDPYVQMSEEDETSIPLVKADTGEVVARIRGASTRRVGRDKLINFLTRGLDVKYGNKLVDIDEHSSSVTAVFKDGSTATGDVIVGCDSARSAVRSFLFTPEEAALETVPALVMNISQTFTRERALFIRNKYHPVVKLGVHPSQPLWQMNMMADICDPDDPETWVFQMLTCRLKKPGEEVNLDTNAERLKYWKEMAEHMCEPFRSAVLWVKDDTYVPVDTFAKWANPVKWSNHGGKVTLAGDAAHPMPPTRGQGLNNALCDSANLLGAIQKAVTGKMSLKEAVDAYDEEVFSRGSREIIMTVNQGHALHHWDLLMDSPLVKTGLGKIQANGPSPA